MEVFNDRIGLIKLRKFKPGFKPFFVGCLLFLNLGAKKKMFPKSIYHHQNWTRIVPGVRDFSISLILIEITVF